MDSEANFKSKYNIDPTYVSHLIVVGDESTDLTTGTSKLTFRAPYTFTLTDVRCSVNTAPSGAALTVDINEAGTSILSTKLTIDAEVAATGTVTLDTGASGSVDTVKVNDVTITSAAVNFDTDLGTTATAVAANITANTSSPDYNAVAVDEVITITAVTAGTGSNTFTVVTAATTITATDVAMSGGVTDKSSRLADAPVVISDSSIIDDSEITIDIDQIGSTIAGAGLKVWLIGSLPA